MNMQNWVRMRSAKQIRTKLYSNFEFTLIYMQNYSWTKDAKSQMGFSFISFHRFVHVMFVYALWDAYMQIEHSLKMKRVPNEYVYTPIARIAMEKENNITYS